VTVTGTYSNLPSDKFPASSGVVVSGPVSGLVFDVKSVSVSGSVTLNGANPVSNTSSCTSNAAGTNYGRGSVVLTDRTQGYRFSGALQGCTNTAATFSVNVFPGTYQVAVEGSYADLPADLYVETTPVAATAPVSGLAYDVKAYLVSGSVTLDGANPVDSNSACSVSVPDGPTYPRGQVYFTDMAQGFGTGTFLDGCGNGTATFSIYLLAGTYEVTVRGVDSDLPGQDYVAVSKITVP
jgi:hypothetical protein